MPLTLREVTVSKRVTVYADAGGARVQPSGQQAAAADADNGTDLPLQRASGGSGEAEEVAGLSAADPPQRAQPPDSDAGPGDDGIEWEDVSPAAAPTPSVPPAEPASGAGDPAVGGLIAAAQRRPPLEQPSEHGE